jgi:glycerol kinase
MPSPDLLLAIDQGTTITRAILFRRGGPGAA